MSLLININESVLEIKSERTRSTKRFHKKRLAADLMGS